MLFQLQNTPNILSYNSTLLMMVSKMAFVYLLANCLILRLFVFLYNDIDDFFNILLIQSLISNSINNLGVIKKEEYNLLEL